VREGFLRLDYNENTTGCSVNVVERIRSLTNDFYSIYPNYQGLSEKVAKYCGVRAEEVLATNGADGALKLVFDCFIDKGDKAIIMDPSFAMFELLLRLCGAQIKKVPYGENYSFPLKQVLKSITQDTKLIVLCSPNNPTGTIISRKDILLILEAAKNSAVLVDEAYYEFLGETVKDEINNFKNLIIVRTFSKAFGLAGLRAGYIVSCKSNIDWLKRAASPFELNSFAKVAIEAALDSKNEAEKYAKTIIENRGLLESALRNLGVKTYPSGANFVLAKFEDSKRVKDFLFERKILVRDVGKNPLLKNRLRITIGTQEQNTRLINSLKESLSGDNKRASCQG